jgi:hypothetical protein
MSTALNIAIGVPIEAVFEENLRLKEENKKMHLILTKAKAAVIQMQAQLKAHRTHYKQTGTQIEVSPAGVRKNFIGKQSLRTANKRSIVVVL